MPKISWIQSGSRFQRMEGDISNVEKLPVGIYEIGCGMSGWFLTKTADKFTFPFKLYNLQRSFLDYVIKSYHSTIGNLGILFNGVRGTGKSVSAKVLANELNLPIIIVKSMGENNQDMISYLASFNFDCVFFFDEFEKQFNENDCSILQIMDGIYTSEYRRVFLLTTNELKINENLLSRPSRIRYIRQFGNLERDSVNEYLDDNLKDPSAKELLLDYIDTLTISTIDILKAIVEEVNIHGIDSFLESKHFFNVESGEYHYRGISGYWWANEKGENFKVSIKDFLEEAERYDKRFEIEENYRADLAASKTEEEANAIKEAYKKARKLSISFERFGFSTNIAWDKLPIGKPLSDDRDEIVVAVNKPAKVVVTRDKDLIQIYRIDNPNERPSLYTDINSRMQNYLI